MANFNPNLASEYLLHRKLVTHPRKFEYMKSNGIDDLDTLHQRMLAVGKDFEAMIMGMIIASKEETLNNGN